MNSAAPLGSIELLMSTEDDFRYGGTAVDRATLPNAQRSVQGWFNRCHGNAGNLALFYFCGHGLERDKQYLLLEDFGEAPLDPLAASIDLDRFHDGMAACAADSQVFLADACRQVPWDLIKTYGDMGTPLIPPRLGGNTDRNAPILRAAAQGRPAFGAPGEVTNFTRALLLALRGAGATEELDGTDRWVVRYLALASAVQTLLAETPADGGRQECRTDRPPLRWVANRKVVHHTYRPAGVVDGRGSRDHPDDEPGPGPFDRGDFAPEGGLRDNQTVAQAIPTYTGCG